MIKIMIVEDERVVAEDIKQTLRKKKFDIVAMSQTGEEAIEKAKVHKPNLVLMDIMLAGEMNGIEATKIIQGELNIPVIYVTAYAEENTLKQAKKTNPYGFLVKPIDDKELYATIEMALKRYQQEEKTRKSESHFRDLYEKSPIPIILLDKKGKIKDLNRAWAELMNYDRDDVLGKSVENLIHRDCKENWAKAMQLIHEEEEIDELEFKMLAKDKEQLNIEMDGMPHYDETGEFSYYYCVLDDITDRLIAENLMRETGEKYKALFEQSDNAILLLKKDKIIECNTHSEIMFGVSKEQLIGNSVVTLSPKKQPDGTTSKQKAFEYINQAMTAGKTNFIWTHQKMDGTPIETDVSLHVLKIGNENFLQAIVHDITEIKRTERIQKVLFNIANAVNICKDIDELLFSLQRYLQEIIDTTNLFVALYDAESHTLSLPFIHDERDTQQSFPAGKTLTGYVIDTGKSLLVNEDEIVKMVDAGLIEIHGPLAKVWLGVPLKIKEEIIGVVAVQSYKDKHLYQEKDKEILEFISTQIAVAIQRKQAETQLKEERAYLEELFESSPVAIVVADSNSHIQRINKEFTNIFGYESDEVIGKNIDNLLTTEKLRKEAGDITDKVAEGEKIAFETKRKTKDGKIIDVAILGTPITFEGQQVGVYGMYQDITERKKIEAEREKLIKDLQNALQEVKTLSGLIPICASCKKIRDDKGFWTNVEEYITKHAEVDFSHAICPECMKEKYPKVYEKMQNKKQENSENKD